MTNAADLFVRQQLDRYASDCEAAARRVPRAQTLREVRQIAAVQPPSIVASLKHLVPERNLLKDAAERRAGEILNEQLDQLRAIASDEALLKERLGFMWANEWVFLRGTYPRLVQHAERETAILKTSDRRFSASERTKG